MTEIHDHTPHDHTQDHDAITDHIRHHLYHAIPGLSVTTIAVVPAGAQGQTFWRESAHHQQ
jgi:hypothetical protein